MESTRLHLTKNIRTTILLKTCLSLRYNIIFLLLFLIFYVPLSAYLDLKVTHYFYNKGLFQTNTFLESIYHYGIIPGWILAGLATLGFILSFFYQEFAKRRRDFLLIILTLALGSGLIGHALLKDHWGRPRPKQTIEFGGAQAFRPFYSPNLSEQPEPSKSFICGHCTMGFYFFSVFFLGLYHQKKALTYFGLIFALFLGGLLSYARVAQGGHFLSDIVMAALIMWWTALFLTYYLLIKKILNYPKS